MGSRADADHEEPNGEDGEEEVSHHAVLLFGAQQRLLFIVYVQLDISGLLAIMISLARHCIQKVG